MVKCMSDIGRRHSQAIYILAAVIMHNDPINTLLLKYFSTASEGSQYNTINGKIIPFFDKIVHRRTLESSICNTQSCDRQILDPGHVLHGIMSTFGFDFHPKVLWLYFQDKTNPVRRQVESFPLGMYVPEAAFNFFRLSEKKVLTVLKRNYLDWRLCSSLRRQ